MIPFIVIANWTSTLKFTSTVPPADLACDERRNSSIAFVHNRSLENDGTGRLTLVFRL